MFKRFTERARQAVQLAQEEARSLQQVQVETRHLLLGLLQMEDGLGQQILKNLGLNYEMVREKVDEATVMRVKVDEATEPIEGPIPFSKHSKKVLETALREALALGHNYIGTEHLLLGLVRGGSAASELLESVGITADAVRAELMTHLTDEIASRVSSKMRSQEVAVELAAELSLRHLREGVRRLVDDALDAGQLVTARKLREIEKEIQ